MEKYLKGYNVFNPGEIEEVLRLGMHKSINKGEFFIKEGEVCQKIAFVYSGIFRSYYLSSSDEEITYCLTFPDAFITAYSSYISQDKSIVNIQAMTEAELFVIQKNEMDKLENSNKNWMLFSRIIAEQYYIALEKRVFQLQTEKAEKRYHDLLNNRSEYIQKIPLKYLASYLGITQRHLSRLRRKSSF